MEVRHVLVLVAMVIEEVGNMTAANGLRKKDLRKHVLHDG